MADPYPIRPFGPDDFDATYLVDEHAFLGRPMTGKRREAYVRQFEFDRSLAAWEDGAPVGLTSVYSLRICVPGAMAPVAGVTYVAVLPTHRRRGILSSLMRHQLADLSENGEAVAALWASEPGIYGRYGYGTASWGTSFRFSRGEGVLGRQAPAPEPGLRLRLADPEAVRDELGKVFDQVLPTRPGMYARNEMWWNRALGTNNESGSDADPVRCLLAEDDAGVRGYAIYTAAQRWDDPTLLPDSALHVSEMVTADPAAAAAIWRDLLSRDLATEFTALLRPVDDPLVLMLSDLRRARRIIADGLWVRVIDVPRALAQRRYSAPLDVIIEVTDDILPRNAARWRLTTHPAPDTPPPAQPAGLSATQTAGPTPAQPAGPSATQTAGSTPGQSASLAARPAAGLAAGQPASPAAGPAAGLVAGQPASPAARLAAGLATTQTAGLVATCEASSAAADLTLDIASLGAAYLGGTRLGELARAGLVTEHSPGALALASTALSWDPPPWCPMIF